jgi:TolB-like protein
MMTNDRPSRLATFIGELRRRHVGRVAIAYGAVAFVLLQAGEIILPAFDFPVLALRMLVVLVFLGLPVALAFAWVYEITPRGIRRTPDVDPAISGRERPGRLLPRLAFLAVTLVTAAGIGWWMLNWDPADSGFLTNPADVRLPGGVTPATADPDAPIRSLAVLPFEDFSTEPQPEFAAGMHDALILQLSQIEALRVVSRTSVLQYASTTRTMPEIGGELGVQAIVEGSVTKAGDQVRIVVQLINAITDTHIWSAEYSRELSNIIGLQGEVAREIAQEIQAELTPEEEVRFAEAPTVNPEAHEAYLRGRYELAKGTPEGHEAAVGFFEEALEADSTYGPAYTGLAGSQLLIAMEDTSVIVNVLPVVLEATGKAIFHADSSPEVQAMVGVLQEQLASADSLLETYGIRIQFDTTDFTNEEWQARFTEIGRQARNIEIAHETKGLGQLSPEKQIAMAQRMKATGQYDQAEKMLKAMLQEDPSNVAAWDALENFYASQGDHEGAVAIRRARAAREGATAEEMSAARELGASHIASQEYWAWYLEELSAKEERGEQVSQVAYAAAYCALDQTDASIAHLERALEAKDPRLGSVFSDPIWDPLRDDPRFRTLIRKIRSTRWQQLPRPPK